MANGRVVQTADRTIGSRQLAALLPPEVLARPGYRALADAVRTLILDGRVALHVRLPAERELAEAVGASRATVTGAYDLLRESGYVRSRRGSGTWTELPEGHDPVGAHALIGGTGGRADGDPGIDLAIAAMGAPDGTLSEAVAWAAPRLPGLARHPGYHPFGLPDLRTAIAERFTRRGLATRPEQILVTAGAQHAFALVVSLLSPARGPGDDREPDLRQRPRRHPARPAAHRVHRRLRRGLGPGDRRIHAAPDRAEARVRDPRLPQPDRRADAGGAATATARGDPADRDLAGGRRNHRRHRPRRRRRPPRRPRWHPGAGPTTW